MAVRPIDGNALELWCEKIIGQACHPVTAQIGEVFLDKVRSATTLTQPNELLTLEELKEMRGRPVWIDELYVWGLVKVIQEKVFLVTINGVYNAEQYKVYRRPPEREEEEKHVIEITENL